MPRRAKAAIAWLGLAGLALLSLFAATEAWGRAGGGGGYSGGGGGGGFGGSGGSGGDGQALFYLIYLCIRYPHIGIPLLCVFAVFSYFSRNAGRNAYRGHVIRRGTVVMSAERRRQAIAALEARDEAFDEQAFYQRVQQAFTKIQTAWCAQDLNSVRAFISDGIAERFTLQFSEQVALGYRPQVENIQFDSVYVAEVQSGEVFDVVAVRIAARADAYRVSRKDGSRVAGFKQTGEFVEFWSFIRRHGAKTTQSLGLIEGFCPNCGTPIEINQWSKCESCQSLLRSGEHDWILAEITQECEWRAAGAATVPGVAAFRAKHDPQFSIQHLEDRTSVIFYRRATADRLGSARPLEKVATPELCRRFAERLGEKTETDGDQTRTYYGECAVGSVTTLGVLAGDPLDRAVIEIRWSGVRYTKPPGGQPQRTGQTSVFRTLYELGRKHGVRTNADLSVSSAHCPGCGAPESDAVADACEFCGAVLNDGSHDWVLLGTFDHWDAEAQELLRRVRAGAESVDSSNGILATAPGDTAVLAWLVKVAVADSHIDEKERGLLTQLAAKSGVSDERLQTLIHAARQGELVSPMPRDADETRSWLTAMADLSMADGRIHRDELRVLCQVGQQCGMSAYDVKLLVRRRHGQLYKAARTAIRQNGRTV